MKVTLFIDTFASSNLLVIHAFLTPITLKPPILRFQQIYTKKPTAERIYTEEVTKKQQTGPQF